MKRTRRRRLARRLGWGATALVAIAAVVAWIGRASPLALVSGLWSGL